MIHINTMFHWWSVCRFLQLVFLSSLYWYLEEKLDNALLGWCKWRSLDHLPWWSIQNSVTITQHHCTLDLFCLWIWFILRRKGCKAVTKCEKQYTVFKKQLMGLLWLYIYLAFCLVKESRAPANGDKDAPFLTNPIKNLNWLPLGLHNDSRTFQRLVFFNVGTLIQTPMHCNIFQPMGTEMLKD